MSSTNEHTLMFEEGSWGTVYRIEGDLIAAKYGAWNPDGSERISMDVKYDLKQFLSTKTSETDGSALHRSNYVETFGDPLSGKTK